jgi:hypothetical protein
VTENAHIRAGIIDVNIGDNGKIIGTYLQQSTVGNGNFMPTGTEAVRGIGVAETISGQTSAGNSDSMVVPTHIHRIPIKR